MAIVVKSVFRSWRNRFAERPPAETPTAARMASRMLAMELPAPLPSKTMSVTRPAAPATTSVIGPQKFRMAREMIQEYGRCA